MDMLAQAKEMRQGSGGKGKKGEGSKDRAEGLKRRFWKDVGVKEVDGLLTFCFPHTHTLDRDICFMLR